MDEEDGGKEMNLFESDGERLARWDQRQRERNLRLHEQFRSDSLMRTNAELRQQWSDMGLDSEKTEQWFIEDAKRSSNL